MAGTPRGALVFGEAMVLALIIVYYALKEYEENDQAKIRFFT